MGDQSDVEEDEEMLMFQGLACGTKGSEPGVSGLGGWLSRGRLGLVLMALMAVLVSGVACVRARAAEPCPNEALRQELHFGALPDCRGYEMVTPAYNGGGKFSVIGVLGLSALAISGDGNHVIASSFSGFAGTESETFENTYYEFSRTGAGWSASALSPPASISPESFFMGTSRDLTKTLWGLHGASQSIYEEDLYLREQNGQLVKVGPLAPPAFGSGPAGGTVPFTHRSPTRPAGASADLSHVVFYVFGEPSNSGARWPDDTTLAHIGVESLYEYVGTGRGRPELVGVSNQGGNITQCGTSLGSAERSGDQYNAISSNGEIIFFTARAHGCEGLNREGKLVKSTESEGPIVNELYARIDGREVVKISEPLESECNSCRTGSTKASTTEKSSEFRGGSEDGSKVFFTTEQELLAGQTTNNLYEYDFDNQRAGSGVIGERGKIVLVSGGSTAPEVQGVARVSEDGSHVYFVARGVLAGANGEGRSPALGADNMYVFERDASYPTGRIGFIAELCSGSGKSGALVAAQCHGSDTRAWQAADSRPVEATPDGRFVVFSSAGDLTSDDTSTVSQLFEYDAQEEKLVRVSIGQNGFNNNGNTTSDPVTLPTPSYSSLDYPTEAETHLVVSNDGSYVFFVSADELTEGAKAASEAGSPSVYEYRSDGSIGNGNVYLVSDGSDTVRNEFGVLGPALLGADGSGADVFFWTGDPLVASDTNTKRDFYDARIGGGFPEPGPSPVCVGEECLGALSSSSSQSRSPGSVSAPAGGNLVAPAVQERPASTESSGTPRTTKRLTRAQQLTEALRGCRRLPKRMRVKCEAQARKRYGTKSTRTARRGR